MRVFVTASTPPILAFLPIHYRAQGYLDDPWWQSGAIGFDDGLYRSGGWGTNPLDKDTVVYGSTGAQVKGMPVLPVTVVNSGGAVAGWRVGDYAALTYGYMPPVTSGLYQPDALGVLGIDPTKFPPIPQPGGPAVTTWAIAVKVLPWSPGGQPPNQPPPPPPPPPGFPPAGPPTGLVAVTYELFGQDRYGRRIHLRDAIQHRHGIYSVKRGVTLVSTADPNEGWGYGGFPGSWPSRYPNTSPQRYGLDPDKGVVQFDGRQVYAVGDSDLTEYLGPNWRAKVYV